MAFSSSNPYQYLAVYFNLFVGPVTSNSVFKYVPNNQYISRLRFWYKFLVSVPDNSGSPERKVLLPI